MLWAIYFYCFESNEKIAIEDTRVDHEKIATQLMGMPKQKWVVVYKFHKAVLNLYQEYNTTLVDKYGQQTYKTEEAEEIIIANF